VAAPIAGQYTATASCSAGTKKAFGGGGLFEDTLTPGVAQAAANINASYPNGPSSWAVVINVTGVVATGQVVAYALCATA
jgi:hypothetical protein